MTEVERRRVRKEGKGATGQGSERRGRNRVEMEGMEKVKRALGQKKRNREK